MGNHKFFSGQNYGLCHCDLGQFSMTRRNVQSSQGVTLIGAGRSSPSDIDLLLERAPVLIAADGGANKCLEYGFSPVAVIGDFDSLTEEARAAFTETRFLHVEEQDSTDFEKSLTHVEAPFILATGFTGARIDHTLATLSALAQYNATPVVLLAHDDIVFHAPPMLYLDLPVGTRVSLFPMSPLIGRSTGLKWPIDGLTLRPDGLVGTSNEATGPITLNLESSGCLIILPREALALALDALCGPALVSGG